mgnify:CR=1 FL=1
MEKEQAARMFEEAMSLYDQERYEEALDILDQLDMAFPGNKDVLYQKAMCLASMGRHDEAMNLSMQLKGQFQDNRIEEMQKWIEQQVNLSMKGSIESGGGEEDISKDITQRDPGTEEQPDQPGGAWPPGYREDHLTKLVMRANISFICSVAAVIMGLLAFGMIMAFAEKPEAPPIIDVSILGLFVLSGVLCILGIIFGILGMGRANNKNRWKAIAGLILGILWLASLMCCFFLIFIVAIAGLPVASDASS